MAIASHIRRFALVCGLLAAGLLSGCAMPRMIDSDVQSFTTGAAAVTPASYRFERLPSQAAEPSPSPLELRAAQALRKVGLTETAQGAAEPARYAVQVSLQITRMVSPYPQSGIGFGLWGHRDGDRRSWLDLAMEPQWYRHAVRLLLRDVASGQIAYETRASFDGPWNDTGNLLPVLLDAALQGFPNPPAGARRVVIELPAAVKEND